MVRRGDDDGVDVLVVEHAAQILSETGLEGRHVLQLRIVDPFAGQVRVDIAQRLVLDVGELRKPALQRVALAANADAGEDNAVVGAENPAADARRRRRLRAEQVAANHHAGRGGAEPCGELAP